MAASAKKVPSRRKPPRALRLLRVASKPRGIEKFLAVRRGRYYEPSRGDPFAVAGRTLHRKLGNFPTRGTLTRLERMPRNMAELQTQRAKVEQDLAGLRAKIDERRRFYRDYGPDVVRLIDRFFRNISVYDMERDVGVVEGSNGPAYVLPERSLHKRMHAAGLASDAEALEQIMADDPRKLDPKERLMNTLRFIRTANGTPAEGENQIVIPQLLNNRRFIADLMNGKRGDVIPNQERRLGVLEGEVQRLRSLEGRMPKTGDFAGEHLVQLYESKYGRIKPGAKEIVMASSKRA